MSLNFNITLADDRLLDKIVGRAKAHIPALQGDSMLAVSMDLTACHCNGCPLQLAELLAAKHEDFEHDVLGIRRHIDRQTGKLPDCFSPRYTVRD